MIKNDKNDELFSDSKQNSYNRKCVHKHVSSDMEWVLTETATTRKLQHTCNNFLLVELSTTSP